MDAAELHPPHVIRLLRLIREGTPSHASRASILLGRYAASCCRGSGVEIEDDGEDDNDVKAEVVGGDKAIVESDPGTLIWDIIGRLVGGDDTNGNADDEINDDDNEVTSGGKKRRRAKKSNKCKQKNNRQCSGLFDANWSTRTNCALALELVSRCLPLDDRRHFFVGIDNDGVSVDTIDPLLKCDEEDKDKVPLWLDVNDLRRVTETEDGGCHIADDRERTNQLDVVMAHGRSLLSSSGEQYDWDVDDATREYIREREALASLDETSASTMIAGDNCINDNIITSELQDSFLAKRVTLQRQILARRLGLGNILNAPILGDASVPTFVDDDDLAPKKSSCIDKKKKTTRSKSSSKNPAESELLVNVKTNKVSIRALLIQQLKRTSSKEISSGFDHHSLRVRANHRNPQMLLGSELAYRTFDSDWSVRHGALLGTLSLLRAWRVHSATSEGKKVLFGLWPRDILARCICILALDQFADYSGFSCGVGGGGDEEKCDGDDVLPSGAVVAPVRETAAQIISILLKAASPETRICAYDLLMQIYTRRCVNDDVVARSNGWAMKHGVLLTWKYIFAMTNFHSNGIGQSQVLPPLLTDMAKTFGTNIKTLNEPSGNSTLDGIIRQAINGLSDYSDDNRAVSSQIIRLSLLLDASSHGIDIAKESSKPLWLAITSTRGGLSSCTADLLHLLAELLSRDCTAFIHCLQEVGGSIPPGSTLLIKMIDFIDDDAINVKISCYCALRLVAEPMTKAILNSYDIRFQSISDYATTLSRILARLFGTYSRPEYIPIGDPAYDISAGELSNNRNQAWSAMLKAIALVIRSNSVFDRSVVDNTFSDMVLQYFGICRSLAPTTSDNINRTNLYIYTRFVHPHGVGEGVTYLSMLASSRALAQIFNMLYLKENPFILSDLICSTLQSPWFRQCEAGYLLHISILSSVELDCSFFAEYLPIMKKTLEIHPICTQLESHAGFNVALSDVQVQSACDSCLAELLDKEKHRQSKNIVQVWEETILNVSGIDREDLRHRSSSTTSRSQMLMRTSALASGALIACGSHNLPLKVTPLIRALMTSLNNEACHSRRIETCHYISKLLSHLSERPMYFKTRTKLLESVCGLACSSEANQTGADYIINLLIGGMTASDNLEDFTPIWQRLSPLMKNPCPNLLVEELHESIYMLRIIAKAMSKECHSFDYILELFMGSAVEVACLSDSEPLRLQACEAIGNFCKIDFTSAMDLIVPPLRSRLTDIQNNSGREGGCHLLLSILRDFEVLASPYVLVLLPIAMRLMTDSVEACSRSAASAFAILVRIAPLAASQLENDVYEMPFGESQSKDVIRHLIMGKPLPPCVVPVKILSQFEKRGITLRPYQIEGITWLRFLADMHLNGALCDDMGLGKTLQALVAVAMSHLACVSSKPRSLVICPSSVVGHWLSEIQRFFPGNDIFAPLNFVGDARSRRRNWLEAFQKCNIVVTSYSVLRNDINILEDVSWEWIILDEGHLLKNPKTFTAQASRRLKSHHKLILTGTPIQNNVHEIWALFDFLLPNFLGSTSKFMNEFAKPILKGQSCQASAADTYQGMECLKLLHQQVLPFILRRVKSQVIQELPPKIIMDVPCSLSKQQSILYQQILGRSGMKEALEIVDKSILGAQSDDYDSNIGGGHVFASLLQLRLICTHPLLHSLFSSRLVNEDSNLSFARLESSGKLLALHDLLCHSGITEPGTIAADNDESCYQVFDADGSDDDYLQNDNSYTFSDNTSVRVGSASKCLVFAQFTQSLDLIERLLFEPHMPTLRYLRLDGSIPENQRSAIVDQFNQDADIQVLILTTKAGGLGLNLTGADKVVFLESDWNPFVDLQAMDRAHRIGQTKTVNVYRLVTTGTIEEKIMELQRRKMATSDAVVNSDNSTIYSNGTDKLLDIFTCRSGGSGSMTDDNVLSYLDDNVCIREYSSFSVDGFLHSMNDDTNLK